MIDPAELKILKNGLDILADASRSLPELTATTNTDAIADVIADVAERMRDNYPYFHPQYAGQMLKPPHPVARIAYALSLWVNPNNHALDGGRASSAMEKECIVELGRMFGWEQPLGHLAGGGTMANLEALWVARQLHPGKTVVASEQAHYTHARISEVLGIPFASVPTDSNGRMDLAALEQMLASGDIGTVVVTMGNTGFGAVDSLTDVLALQQEYPFRVHADAAYGGYFLLADKASAATRANYQALTQVDSIVIDPHKHGLQPYGCGCILFRDADVGRIYKHDSPYTYFSSAELHLGEISLECSRPGASAVALWATMQLLPLERSGDFARSLDNCLVAARDFYDGLESSANFRPLMTPELDIVVYAAAAGDFESASRKARRLFDTAANKELHLALINVPAAIAGHWLGGMEQNADHVTCLRSVLMKPEQIDWTARLLALLESSAEEPD